MSLADALPNTPAGRIAKLLFFGTSLKMGFATNFRNPQWNSTGVFDLMDLSTKWGR